MNVLKIGYLSGSIGKNTSAIFDAAKINKLYKKEKLKKEKKDKEKKDKEKKEKKDKD